MCRRKHRTTTHQKERTPLLKSLIRLSLALALPAAGALALSLPARANVRTSTLASACQHASSVVRFRQSPGHSRPGQRQW